MTLKKGMNNMTMNRSTKYCYNKSPKGTWFLFCYSEGSQKKIFFKETGKEKKNLEGEIYHLSVHNT